MKTTIQNELAEIIRLSKETSIPVNHIIELYKVIEMKRQNDLFKAAHNVYSDKSPSALEAIAMSLGKSSRFDDSVPSSIRAIAEAIDSKYRRSFCNVCNLPTDGNKCFYRHCPVEPDN